MKNDLFANVIVDINTEALNKSFVFKVPNNLKKKVVSGVKVIIPFGKGNKEKEGFVLEVFDEEILKSKNFYKKDNYFKKKDAIENLKEIKDIANKKLEISDILLKIAIFLCKEYYAPISKCLNTVMPIKKKVRKNKKQVDAINKYDDTIKKTEKIELNNEQKNIIDKIIKSHKKNKFSEHLVYGITGSGKTEVYIKIIEEVLKENKKVIVLIPEIALTHQTVIRLREKFYKNIAIIHSKMSEGDRYIQYNKCLTGEVDIIVGPRSAVFAPFINLGLVVIDEVDDSAYKSEISPRYDTLKVARYRCLEQNATLVTLSATPKISYYYDAENGNGINLYRLENRAKSILPSVILVDMKKEIKNGNITPFSKILIDKINDRLEKKEQVMLYMNRRGYDTIFTCKICGETYKCPHCDVSLCSHFDGKLKCHYCGFEIDEPLTCPNCGASKIEKYGMGTEKLEEICQDIFKNARILRMDRDTTKEKDGHDKIIKKFRAKEADILIGTQMIVKGHDFKDVTLVAVMRADLSLYMQDYKAQEYTYSMLTQCIGRSGRENKGESIIQGYDIDNFVIKQVASQNYSKFYEEEIKFRKKLNYPPFSKMLYIYLRSLNYEILDDGSKKLKLFLETRNEYDAVLLGPTDTNPAKKKDIYYKVIYVKCKKLDDAKIFRRLSENFINYFYKNGNIKTTYDIEE